MMDAYLPYRMRLTSQMWWILSTAPEALTVLIFREKALPVYRPFYVEATGPGMPEMNEKVRVLNPVACMRSRFSNLIALRRDAELKLRVLTRSRSRVISFSSNSLMNSRSKLHEESLWIYGGSRMTKAVCAIRPSGIAGRGRFLKGNKVTTSL